jgi:hypothetical protein
MKKERTAVVLTLIEIAIGVASAGLLQQPAHAQGPLTGKPLHSGLCAIAACPQSPKPVAKALESVSVVSPGGKVVLQGVYFNSLDGQAGEIVLKIGNKRDVTVLNLGNTGYRQPYLERQLTVLGWADGHTFGQIPDEISGVMDGPATLEVWRSDGRKSDPLTVHFTAARDLTILPIEDVTPQSCAATADSNLCNHWSDSTQLSIPPNVLPSPSLYGWHVMFIPSQQGPKVYGTDVFNFSLKNGWTLDNSDPIANYLYYPTKACIEDDNSPPNFTGSKTMGGVRIAWQVGCSLQYHVSLHITGPKGVPWK